MADRRIGDRRTPDKGTINIKFKDAVIYLAVSVIIIISVSANIVLIRKNRQYKKIIELYELGEKYGIYQNYIDDVEE